MSFGGASGYARACAGDAIAGRPGHVPIFASPPPERFCCALMPSRDPVASRRFDELVDTAELRVEPVTHDQARIARDAYRDFGKGSGHKASLNFGDCFAYAWQSPPEKRCCSREPTSATPTSRLRSSLRQTITPADPEW